MPESNYEPRHLRPEGNSALPMGCGEVSPENQSWLKRALHVGKRGVEAAVIVAEVTPANEAIRVAAFATAQAISGDPVTGALAYGGSTFIIEGAAAVAAGDYLATRSKDPIVKDGLMRKAIDWTDDKVDRIIPRDGQMSLAAQGATAFLGGSAVLMWAHDRQNPGLTRGEQIRYGLSMSGVMAGICAVQGALVAEGISSPSPRSIGIALLGVAGIPAAASWMKKHFTKGGGKIDEGNE